MISEVVARRYAKALFLITSPLELESVAADLRELSSVISSRADLEWILNSPVVKPEKKQRILGALAQRLALSPVVGRLSNLLVEKGRMDHFQAVVRWYGELVDEKLERINAYVTVAEEPTAEQIGKLTETVKALSNKQKIVLHKNVDAELLGGFIVRIGDRVYDASLRSELQRIERTLAE